METIDLSVIILSYRSKEHLKALLPSIAESRTKYTYEVIVVDNGSNDGTGEWLQNAKLQISNFKFIQNINNGFAAGNNIGIKQASGRYILLLNPDTTVQPDTFEAMLDFMESRPDVGMSTCKLIKPDGTLDRAARRNFPNPANAFLRFLHLQHLASKPYNISDETADQEMEIESLVGAFCLTRRDVIEKIGLLDESFFMYGEDLDWCWRCREAGWKVWYYPKTFITHHKGESSKKAAFRALKWFHDAMWIFYRKHYWQKYPLPLNWLVWVGIYGRLAALAVVNSFKSNPRVSK